VAILLMIIESKSMMILVYLLTLDEDFPTSLSLVSYYISISNNAGSLSITSTPWIVPDYCLYNPEDSSLTAVFLL
jgi:hypothetical protein